MLEDFVKMCVEQGRLFYLDELIGFYKKTDRLEELRRVYLDNGVLIFNYKGFEDLVKIEKEEMLAQKAYCKMNKLHNE